MARGHRVSRTVVGELLKAQKFSLQANSKTNEGGDHPDRDAQFSHINQSVTTALAAQQPVISVDTKKKELVGDFKNAGREWRPQGEPEAVRVHDFLIKELGRAVPYGIYDLAANAGWVSVGMNHDTAAFAVQSIRRWWQDIGCKRYPAAKRLTITCDGGGSNGSRVRLWKLELQKLASQLDIDITVHHLPPGTSKWNKIEHRLFSFIHDLGFGYVIRFRGNIHVTDADGETRPAADWVGKSGRARKLRGAQVTASHAYKVGAVVCVHAKAMKEPWCLAVSNAEASTAM